MSRFDFPITRYLSGILLPAFLRVRITPNTVTIIGLIIGLLSAFLFLAPDSSVSYTHLTLPTIYSV